MRPSRCKLIVCGDGNARGRGRIGPRFWNRRPYIQPVMRSDLGDMVDHIIERLEARERRVGEGTLLTSREHHD